MSTDLPALRSGLLWSVVHLSFAAGQYRHPAAGILQVRLVRRGSSPARVDLGATPRDVVTRPGDLLVSLPDRGTRFAISERRDLTVLQVQRAHALRLLQRLGAKDFDDLMPLLVGPVRDPFTAALVRRLQRSDDAMQPQHEWAVGLVMHGLLALAQSSAGRTPRPVLSLPDIETLVRRIDDRPDEAWTVDRLAGEAGLSRRAFAAAFKAAKGLPVHQFVMGRRVERAIELLLGTSAAVTDIAAATGFAHQAHLSRVLKNLKGRTPGEIRAAGRAIPESP